MMLCYKAWTESRLRFGIVLLALVWACGAVVAIQGASRAHADEPMTYAQFVWKAVYRGAVRDLFALLAMTLGLGGLRQEQANGTVGFTLALPVSRTRLVVSRAAVGLVEVAVLGFVPAMVLTLLSPLTGQSYRLYQGAVYGLLWAAGGVVLFAATFLFSTLLAGEFTPWIAGVVSLVAYLMVVHLPPLSAAPRLDFLQVMSGSGMPYFRTSDSTLIGPVPWAAVGGMILSGVVLMWTAGRATERGDFS